ncbi:MAG: alpha/beta hydrolase [Gammaproteobacteria bacterium]|nr:alpha/beta hydrolase [Gammaproteobacteria bacterium]
MPRALANGIELEYATVGNAGDPAIVLIRGLGTQMIEWPAAMLEELVSAGLFVVIFDNRDAGLSSKLGSDYELADMAADVIGLLDALRIDRAHVLGISLGGMVAQLVGHGYPERVRCLFSVMSSSGDPELPLAAKQIRARLLETASGREAVIRRTADNKVAFGSPDYPESEAERMAAASAAYDRCYCPDGVARQMQAVLNDGSRVARLQQIVLPTLVIHGADDPLIPCAAGEDTARHIPAAELQLVPGMGHNIPTALAPELVKLIVDFIAAHHP